MVDAVRGRGIGVRPLRIAAPIRQELHLIIGGLNATCIQELRYTCTIIGGANNAVRPDVIETLVELTDVALLFLVSESGFEKSRQPQLQILLQIELSTNHGVPASALVLAQVESRPCIAVVIIHVRPLGLPDGGVDRGFRMVDNPADIRKAQLKQAFAPT